MGHRLWFWVRAIVVGWAALVPLAYITERLLLRWTASLLGAGWLPTVRVTLDGLALAATGWMIGRVHRSAPISGVLAFAATLSFRDLDPLLAINVPWLIRLVADALRDSRYLGSLVETASEHLLLFGSLFAGALLSRPSRRPVSLFNSTVQ